MVSEDSEVVNKLGIIFSNKSINLILSSLISDINDGKFSIERTKLDSMNDHISMSVIHRLMIKDDAVIAQIIYLLKHGKSIRQTDNEVS